ncbi:MAG: threonine--tRNA ligase [Chloroflexi bacterium]|jgi:threonyl-tRNA synthetase|nr:threonine--tRNA ligase [Chloroflexota bacterium]MBT7081199.1 threonine--tRNA ligase [Chloroflexota bacterium]MBT7290254.1 threonine--tRNA ligase [Chloroflexota bacterium]
MSEKLEALRHSASHIMAEAVLSVFGDVKFGIGPSIEDGFYYDFQLPRTLTPDDLVAIEAKMTEIVASKTPFTQEDLSKDEAKKLFADQPYKLELIAELPDESVSIYRQGDFVDLCKGPHVESTAQIRAFKLLTIAGAYWRGNEKKPMLQRIYGTAFDNRKALKKHLARLEEAAKRDHRRIGKDLDLFSIQDDGGAGLAHWHPKGGMVRMLIEDFWRAEHIKRGYDIVYTPHIAKIDLWKTSGHLDFYKDSMYSPMDIDGQDYMIKPMNCPAHILMYKNRLRSYRELPLRWAELGTVYRYERSGALHGMTRVRGFTQDDAHIFCTPDQLESEVADVVEFALFMLNSFGFVEYEIYLSTRPDKYVGSIEVWDMATETLEKALKKLNVDYTVDPGEGVFYGPKIDIKLKDALGRTWQGPTTQVDFNLPERFDVNYIGQDSAEHRIVMVHRTVLGSMERFMGCLIEHYAGAFPVWLAPLQAMLIPIADRHIEYAQKVAAQLKSRGIRSDVDARSERMNLKIRDAQMQKVPYMLIVGDDEAENDTVSVRTREGQDIKGKSVADFIDLAKETIESKT